MTSKTVSIGLIAALALGALLGCTRNDDAGDVAPADNAPIQDCRTLTAPANREYRISSVRECLAQPSLDARMKSKACLVQQELGRCITKKEAQANGYGGDQLRAEMQEARTR